MTKRWHIESCVSIGESEKRRASDDFVVSLYIWSTNKFCIQPIYTYTRIDVFMICMYIWKIHLFVVPVPVSLCVVVIVIVGCYGWNTTWHDPHRLTAEDAPGVDLQPHSTQACCAGDPKINGWNQQSSPMKRKEHDLNQTSRKLCSMLIFRGVNCRFQKLTCVEVAFGDSKRVTVFVVFVGGEFLQQKWNPCFFFKGHPGEAPTCKKR